MKRFLRGNETIERLNIKKICDNVQTIYITLVTADEDKVAQAMKTCSSSLLQCKDDKHLLNDSISETSDRCYDDIGKDDTYKIGWNVCRTRHECFFFLRFRCFTFTSKYIQCSSCR